jgi:hypothetical protein
VSGGGVGGRRSVLAGGRGASGGALPSAGVGTGGRRVDEDGK